MAKKKAKKHVLMDKVTEPQHDASVVDQKSSSADRPQRPRTSPYTELPVELNVGPDRMPYYVPRHILPAEWSKTGLEKRLCLAEIDQETGHTLVHYLYSKDYETLDVVTESPLSETCIEFTRALLVYIMTVRYNGLNGLRVLAISEMEDLGSRLNICEVVGAIKDHFSKLESPSWIHDYVRKRANVAFAEDHTIFKSTTFLESIGNADYDKFMMRCVMDSYDERIAHMAEAEKVLSEKLEQQILEARDGSVGGSVPEEKEKMLEDFILPHIDEVIEVNHGQEASEQCSILTGDLCTTECSALEYAASFSVEEAPPSEEVPPPAESCWSDISLVEYPDEASQATLQDNDLNNHPERVVAESEEEEKKVELARMHVEAASDTAPERALVKTEDGAVAEITRFQPEHVPELRAELDWKPQPCSRQAEHMLEERWWRECKLCRAVLQRVAVQLAQCS